MIMSFDPNEKKIAICERKLAMKCVKAVESDSVKSARKAEDKACERASEIRERTSYKLSRSKTECARQA